MIDMNSMYLSEDAGVFLASFLKASVMYIQELVRGTAKDREYAVDPNKSRLVITSTQINAGSTRFVIRFTVDRNLQAIQVRLIDCSDETDPYGADRGMDIQTQYIDMKMEAVPYIKGQVETIYHSMSNIPADNGIVMTQIKHNYKSVFDVVSDIISATAEYAYEYGQRGQGDMTQYVPNGMVISFGFIGNELNCSINFGEVLTRAVKLDSMFI